MWAREVWYLEKFNTYKEDAGKLKKIINNTVTFTSNFDRKWTNLSLLAAAIFLNRPPPKAPWYWAQSHDDDSNPRWWTSLRRTTLVDRPCWSSLAEEMRSLQSFSGFPTLYRQCLSKKRKKIAINMARFWRTSRISKVPITTRTA